MEKIVFFRKVDIAVIFILIVLCGWFYFLYFNNDKGERALIIYDSVTVKDLSLKEDAVFSITEVPEVVFEIKDGRIAFIKSDCPDKVCVRTGPVGRDGQSAICLPNKLMILVKSTVDTEVDSVVN